MIVIITRRGRTDGAFADCQGDHKPITVRDMRRAGMPSQ
jgi:hypothetical protein